MKGVGWLCRVETSEKVSRALVTVPLPLIRMTWISLTDPLELVHDMLMRWGRPQRQRDDL